MDSFVKYKKKFFIILFASIIFYAAFAIFSDFDELIKNVKNLHLEYVPLILISWTIASIIRGYRQHIILSNSKISIGLKNNIGIYLSGLILMLTPLGSGSVIKSEFIKNKFGIQRRKTISLVLVERLLDFITILSFLIISLFFLISEITLILSIVAGSFLVFSIILLKSRRALIFVKNKNF